MKNIPSYRSKGFVIFARTNDSEIILTDKQGHFLLARQNNAHANLTINNIPYQIIATI